MNGYELLAQFEKEIKECFTVPNNLLPEEFQDNRMVYEQVSLATLEKKCDERDQIKSISAEQEDSIERAKRVQIYREQLERTGKIEYHPII